ncbi:hypothetical protein [Gordonia malaquae]|uniref:hypothetical protein n=1 Tax=Gordonia malaquae TaxID=410332 RepID=UPI0030172689
MTASYEAVITEMVALYISNEGGDDNGRRIAYRASDLAKAGDLDGLKTYVTGIVRTHPDARDVRSELASADYDRINWEAVAAQIQLEE